MSCVTTCTQCGTLYEESSEEQANSPNRICTTCWKKAQGLQDDLAPSAIAIGTMRDLLNQLG